jgi:hypothetical protein
MDDAESKSWLRFNPPAAQTQEAAATGPGAAEAPPDLSQAKA